MRDQMQKGDGVLFYHSSCPVPGIAGFARVCSDAYPDPTQFDQRSKYYDDKSKPSTPRWFLVDIQFVKKLKDVIPLEVIKSNPALADMKLVQRGQRLSVQPVTPAEWKAIVAMTG
jgi:predicted RNA-binding protein with PUA-like domain